MKTDGYNEVNTADAVQKMRNDEDRTKLIEFSSALAQRWSV